ncbi:MAG: aminotransferase class III-fold pyridoxal phosphate-dependent enzyme, partial [Flavobacteriales bacterium]|nr:aminotransferase class III-fold pyridoxal phosphate-dependent enzyme [Flavobacteriales bacterium]
STHSANPLVCVAGHQNLKAMYEDGLIDNSENLGNIFHQRLNEIKNKYHNHLRYVFGKGLLAALLRILLQHWAGKVRILQQPFWLLLLM